MVNKIRGDQNVIMGFNVFSLEKVYIKPVPLLYDRL